MIINHDRSFLQNLTNRTAPTCGDRIPGDEYEEWRVAGLSTKFPDQIWLGNDVHGLVAGRSFLGNNHGTFSHAL
jgi:hypothetical protein